MFPLNQTSPPSLFNARQVQSVSELTSSLTLLLESEFPFVAISGEISNLRRPYSGHHYFTLKDSQAQIRCVLFKSQQRYLEKPLAVGAKVICKGRISVYKQRGEYQIIVDHVTEEGLGNLRQQFERLKEKLFTEGLFAPESKKKLPAFVRKICLITSPTGAAVHDFLKKSLERFPNLEVEIFPAAVQGENAATDIVSQIALANKRNWADIIVLTRGGGSLEDLAAFNNEQLARAIHASEIPLVAAIGHEVDFTIADLAADHRSPTPTAAAEEVVVNKKQLHDGLSLLTQRMKNSLETSLQRNKTRLHVLEKLLTDPRKIIDHYQLKVDHITLNLIHLFTRKRDFARKRLESNRQKLTAHSPEKKLSAAKIRCDNLTIQLSQHIKDTFQKKWENFTRQATLLDALSPLAVLGRGYAMVLNKDKKIIHSIRQVASGDQIQVRVEDGTIQSVVEKTVNN
ncbi:MAG: exodeoxyribonuclease VII large subunit [Thermodesulfobacteriota bacterium]